MSKNHCMRIDLLVAEGAFLLRWQSEVAVKAEFEDRVRLQD